MKYDVFSNAVRLHTPSEADRAQPVELSEIVEGILPLIKEDREYLGLIDSHGTTLQLMYDSVKDEFWVEVPCPAEQGSYGAWLNFDNARGLLTALPAEFPLKGFLGFGFQSWR